MTRPHARQGDGRDPARPADVLVQLRGVRSHFTERISLLQRGIGQRAPVLRAVDGVDLEIRRGEILGLVGESGCGKTTLGRTILCRAPLTSGELIFDGLDLARVRRTDLRRLRRRMQMIFQDPYSSLSPRLKVAHTLLEPYTIHDTPARERYSVSELLEMVELPPELAVKYPHELSGGQARRVGIARALALHPEFIVADEPTAGLDVSASSSVLNLMTGLRDRLGLTYLVITHNLNTLGYIADRIAVMYLGKIVEIGSADQIFDAPAHPYTIALWSSASDPRTGARSSRRMLTPGEIPSPKYPPPGCSFHPRCAFADARSRTQEPLLETIESEHRVACHNWREVRSASPVLAAEAEAKAEGLPPAHPGKQPLS